MLFGEILRRMKILIIDNNRHIGGYPQGMMIRGIISLRHKCRILTPETISLEKIDTDRVILTGSTAYVRQAMPWMKNEKKLIDFCIKKRIPILGICFGGQLLAEHLWGKDAVQSLPAPISGNVLFSVTKNNQLFKGLPDEFGVTSTHYEGFKVPEKYITGKIEEWDSYSFSKDSIHGIQFHPELMGNLGKTLLRFQKFFYDRNIYQDFSTESHIKNGKRILKNFIDSP